MRGRRGGKGRWGFRGWLWIEVDATQGGMDQSLRMIVLRMMLPLAKLLFRDMCRMKHDFPIRKEENCVARALLSRWLLCPRSKKEINRRQSTLCILFVSKLNKALGLNTILHIFLIGVSQSTSEKKPS